ncbi:MAG: MBL fold metallo-hydrolase [Peptococcaceae bacterium]|jgi:7,8-dihydropterin-6-yl-methyl-4-(beta-D-ribofuranosyl)aminobenzene 5'-phosphate synthase|nr:MBL fold metallo-hydrolase [Peptococcaceae bacterium]
MIIKTLVENTSISEKFKSEHGLCLYLETRKHKLLFDLGASYLFAENAHVLGLDLSEIDTVVISHGHYDHGGGLKAFLNLNTKAKIYVNRKAFGKYYALSPDGKKTNIGLDESLLQSDRLIFTGEHFVIDDELELFAGVTGTKLLSSANRGLLMEEAGLPVQDDFDHEQNLIVNQDGKTLLVAGCAHKGIINILDRLMELKNIQPNYVIGGFHLYSYAADKYEDPELIRELAQYLKEFDTTFYTCHCTGTKAYNDLREIMGKKIEYLATGSELKI